jgi:hypothetical protein
MNSYYFNNPYVNRNGISPDGGKISRTKDEYPYSYSEFLVWVKKQEYIKKPECGGYYSDRLFQWDHKKYDKCCREVWGNEGQHFDSREPKDIENFLRLYNDDPELELRKISEGCNVGNGYPYWVFWYKSGKTS